MTAMSASVIVTTYNRPEALRAVLRSLAEQSRSDFEVLVADDGSAPATARVVEATRPLFGDRLLHVWHEDQGFRAAAIRNRAAEQARGSILCFLDGDCVPRSHYVDACLRSAHPKVVLRGSRVLLNEAFTRRCESGEVFLHLLGKRELRRLVRRGQINRSSPLRSGPLDRLRMLSALLHPRDWRLVRGCNFAVPAEAFRAVHGFDEAFEGWGFEDSDLCIRLVNLGLRIRRAPAAACVMHLWHREQPRDLAGANLDRMRRTERSRTILPTRGMNLERLSP